MPNLKVPGVTAIDVEMTYSQAVRFVSLTLEFGKSSVLDKTNDARLEDCGGHAG